MKNLLVPRRVAGALLVPLVVAVLVHMALSSDAQAIAQDSGPQDQSHWPRDESLPIPYRQLTWEDFQGPVRPDSDRGAWLASGLALSTMGRITVERIAEEGEARWEASVPGAIVIAGVNPLLSGVYDRMRKDHVLAHEQLHFDITEYWARRLTREMRDFRAPGREKHLAEQDLKILVQELLERGRAELAAMQKSYDREASGRSKGKAQKRWNKEVAELLRATPPVAGEE